MFTDVEVRGESPVREPGPDPLTSDLLGRRPPQDLAGLPADQIFLSARSKSKDMIRRRLEGMDEQFDAINQMSNNIEQDFKNTKLVSQVFLFKTIFKGDNLVSCST